MNHSSFVNDAELSGNKFTISGGRSGELLSHFLSRRGIKREDNDKMYINVT